MRSQLIPMLFATLVAAVSLRGQASPAPRAPLAFDVVSIKPNTSGEQGGTSRAQPGRYQGTNVTLERVIGLAYRSVQEFAGGLEMLRSLLADRFKLVVHEETKNSPVYALTLARRDGRLGPRLRRTETECAPPDSAPRPAPASEGRCGFRLGNGALNGQGTTMARLAGELSFVGRAPRRELSTR